MPRTKQRTPELRERVLVEAVELLASDGVAGFTTRKVAERARTSTPAVYELFGAKGGLLREVFFQGFRELGARFENSPPTGDPGADVLAAARTFRVFAHENRVMFELMYSHPFADFAPGPAEVRAGQAVAEQILMRVEACVHANLIEGDAEDISHVLMATCQGLASAENAGRLGSSQKSADRRWQLALDAVLCGLAAE